MKRSAKPILPRVRNLWWSVQLDFDPKSGEFAYYAVEIDYQVSIEDQRKILVLNGNAKDYEQPERNRAREFTRRLADTMNSLAY